MELLDKARPGKLIKDQMRKHAKVEYKDGVKFTFSWCSEVMRNLGYTDPAKAHNVKDGSDPVPDRRDSSLNTQIYAAVSYLRTALSRVSAAVADAVDKGHLFKALRLTQTDIMTAGRILTERRLAMINEAEKFMTRKQAAKYVRGREPGHHMLFRSRDRDTALFAGWTGLQCKCGSWRVERDPAGSSFEDTVCADCGARGRYGFISSRRSCNELFEDMIKKAKKTGKCPSCKNALKALPSAEELEVAR